MHVVGHNHVAPDCPAMATTSNSPIVDEYLSNFFRCQNRSSLESACGHEINRPVDPGTFEPVQVLVHAPICSRHSLADITDEFCIPTCVPAEITDLGYNFTAFARLNTRDEFFGP
jgi:hypothetical protein